MHFSSATPHGCTGRSSPAFGRILSALPPLETLTGPQLKHFVIHWPPNLSFPQGREMKSVKPLLAVLLLFSYVCGQECVPNSIKIGSLEYGGTNSSGASTYIVKLNTTGVTAAPLTFGNVRVHVNGLFQDTAPQGPITTSANILYVGGGSFTG